MLCDKNTNAHFLLLPSPQNTEFVPLPMKFFMCILEPIPSCFLKEYVQLVIFFKKKFFFFYFWLSWVFIWLLWCSNILTNLPAVPETRIWSLGREDPLEKGMATHLSVHAGRIPWTDENSPWGGKESNMTEWLALSLHCYSGFFSSCGERGLLSSCGVQASHCSGSSCC